MIDLKYQISNSHKNQITIACSRTIDMISLQVPIFGEENEEKRKTISRVNDDDGCDVKGARSIVKVAATTFNSIFLADFIRRKEKRKRNEKKIRGIRHERTPHTSPAISVIKWIISRCFT